MSTRRAPGQELVLLETFSSESEADLLIGLLAQAGIPAAIRRDDAGGLVPALDPLRGLTVMIDAADLERARQALADVEPLEEGAAVPGGEPEELELPDDEVD